MLPLPGKFKCIDAFAMTVIPSMAMLLLWEKRVEAAIEKSRMKYTQNEIQNELLDLMAQHVARQKLH